MSRKEATFGQLLGYMNREAASERYSLRHNCYARKESELEAEFAANSERLRARKNGVFLYHEILSITKAGDLSDEERKDALREIAQKYIEMRCPESLVYGVVHDDHSHHLHYHLMISANAVGSAERLRLSKADFQALKVQMERRVLSERPELEQKTSIEKEPSERLSRRGGELQRRTGETPERDALKERVLAVFEAAQTKEELFERLKSEKVELYTRGNTIGVIDLETGRKHRLKTIGLWPAFEALEPRFKQGMAKDPFELPPPPEVIRQPVEKTVALVESLPHRLADAVRSVPGEVSEVAKEIAAKINPVSEEKASSNKGAAQISAQQEPKVGLWERAKAVYSRMRNKASESTQEPRSSKSDKANRQSLPLFSGRPQKAAKTQSRPPAQVEQFRQQRPQEQAPSQQRAASSRKQDRRPPESDIDRIARERVQALRKATRHLRDSRERQDDDESER